jgi:hypothetical protein
MNGALGIQGDIPLEASLLPTCGAVWGQTDFSCSSQNISGALMRGPLRVRLSLTGAEQPDHQEGEFDWLTEAAAKMKAILKHVRSWLELGCGSSCNSGGGTAEPAANYREGLVFPTISILEYQHFTSASVGLVVWSAAMEVSCIRGLSYLVFCCCRNSQISQALWWKVH